MSQLKPPQIEVVQRVAGYFFQDIVENSPSSQGALQEIEVVITEQKAVEMTDESLPQYKDMNQVEPLASNELDLRQALNMTVDVVAYYAGSDADFDLKTTIEQGLVKDHPLLFQLLSQEDKVFSALAITTAATSRSIPDGDTVFPPKYPRRGMSGGGIALATVLALGAIALGVAASIFGIRSYRTTTYGKELLSPQSNTSSSIELMRRAADVVMPSKSQRQKSRDEEEEAAEEPEFDIESMQSSVEEANNKSPSNAGGKIRQQYDNAVSTSRSTSWENKSGGGLTFNQLLPQQYTAKKEIARLPASKHDGATAQRRLQHRTKDPPSAESEANFAMSNNYTKNNSIAALFDDNVSDSNRC